MRMWSYSSSVIRIINTSAAIQPTPQPCLAMQPNWCILETESVSQVLNSFLRWVWCCTAKKANENTVLIDTTVQEKNITYPTDSKLAIKIINRLNKLAKKQGIKQLNSPLIRGARGVRKDEYWFLAQSLSQERQMLGFLHSLLMPRLTINNTLCASQWPRRLHKALFNVQCFERNITTRFVIAGSNHMVYEARFTS